MRGHVRIFENKAFFVELQLLQSINIFNLFHLIILRKQLAELFIHCVNERRPMAKMNNKKEWKIENVLDIRNYQRKLVYQVKLVV